VSDTSRSASSICAICYKKSMLGGMGIKYGRGRGGARISLLQGSVLSREYFPSSIIYYMKNEKFTESPDAANAGLVKNNG